VVWERMSELGAESERRSSRELAGDVARIAGELAETEEHLAAELERRAEADAVQGDELRTQAREVRVSAENERRVQQRWQLFSDTG
jgi:hypothetical protein